LSVPSNATSLSGYTAAVSTFSDTYFTGLINTTNLTTLVNEVDFIKSGAK
jgi:hypothetical protein